ncbi:MAG: hypothetical protein COA78_01815 [Blastopirellula sp.]|nr:MAG: hypothetical protein COA78_01815 [Blastopirellula sp.]
MNYESELPTSPKNSGITLESPVETQSCQTIAEFSTWLDAELQNLEDKYADQITRKSLAVSLKRN